MKAQFLKLSLVTLCLLIGSANAQAQQGLPKTAPVLKLSDPLPGNLFVELARVVNPSIVNISTSVVPQGRTARDPMMEMLEQFYGQQFQAPRQQQPGKARRMGLGTGFIVREDGLIVTNAHVIAGADIVEVQLTENAEKQYKAKVLGFDQRTDIALLKITPTEKLTAVTLGNSKEAQVGEWVAAFGNPFGHGHTMTKGIISSTGRAIEEINKYPLIQTDASINPGNSGGPLVNSKGLVIGVNSAIDARAQGIGFAIPIDEVKKIIPQLEQNGSIRKGYLGLSPGDINSEDDDLKGAVVMAVGDGPAKKGGIRVYDLITEVDSKKIKSARELVDTVSDIEPGKKVKVKLIRADKPKTVDVTIGERPEEVTRTMQESPSKKPNGQKAPFNLGFSITDLTPELRKDWKVESDVQKPMVVEVERNSVASLQGVRVGDVIVDVNKVEIKTTNDVLKALKKGTNKIKVARPDGVSILEIEVR
ncbi:MAG: trypsin-like peptidase domain-containing protein [Bdellovibrio sp.]|nr:trypsin-like peptidase domain-containing protein [Bdellovibrio sp.]